MNFANNDQELRHCLQINNIMSRRKFNSRERVHMYLSANGKCQLCSKQLHSGWHADHILPWSANGLTSLLNGQALCKSCNLKKGTKTMTVRPTLSDWTSKLRDWQSDAESIYTSMQDKPFLAAVTPGSGKTMWALKIAHKLLRSRIVNRVVVCCPSAMLCKSWADEAGNNNIQLDYNFKNKDCFEIPSDFHGIAVTYNSVASKPTLYQYQCRNDRTLVILDEVHHLGDNLTWSEKAKIAFGAAVRILMLSGTPFRSDNNPIPWVTYNDNVSVPDYNYSYNEALRDKIVIPVKFPGYESDSKWIRGNKEKSATFTDQVSEKDAADRLRTFLNPSLDGMRSMLLEANNWLMGVRKTDHTAGGMITAIDINHANSIRDFLNSCGIENVLATSDDENASSIVNGFKHGYQPWIIAVKLISEGINIPRLCVGVHATNITERLFFRQNVHRITRFNNQLPHTSQGALYFIPADNTLIMHAKEIFDERNHTIDNRETTNDQASSTSDATKMSFVPLESTSVEHIGIIDGNNIYSPDDIEIVNKFNEECGYPITLPDCRTPHLARLLRSQNLANGITQHAQPAMYRLNNADQTKALKDRKTRLAKTLAGRIKNVLHIEFKDAITAIYRYVRLHTDTHNDDKLSIEQLRKQIKILEEFIRDCASDNDYSRLYMGICNENNKI